MQQPLPAFLCPTRRALALYPCDITQPLVNATVLRRAAKSDYAINAGDIDPGGGPGPRSLSEGDRSLYRWKDFSGATGVSYLRSRVRSADLADGASHTYLLGEKRVALKSLSIGDDQAMYTGYDYDTFRWAKVGSVPTSDSSTDMPAEFGARHKSTCSFVFCDGSVRQVSYAVDAEVHRASANRRDSN
jgi:prepilin-type processing-associated H-X9-DG protein